MSKQLLVEYDSGSIAPEKNKLFINEMAKIGGNDVIIEEPLYVIAILQKAGVENRNGRIYPKHILNRENERYQQYILEKRALGEECHPDNVIINSERVTHNIVQTWWEGDVLYGKLEIIMSPGFLKTGIISCHGDNIANLIRKGIKIGVSSRGVGSLKKINGNNIVQDDFELICWDIVTQPSTPGAWFIENNSEKNKSPTVNESLDIENNKNLIEKLNFFLD